MMGSKRLPVPPVRALDRLKERFAEADPIGYKEIAKEGLSIARESRDLLKEIVALLKELRE